MAVKAFLRRAYNEYSKLGMRRKKKQVWRKPKGRDNKMREKRAGYPAVVSIGYGSERSSRGKLNNQTPLIVKNINDFAKIGKNNIAIIASVGKKKKLALAKFAKEHRIQIYNLNPEIFLKRNSKKVKVKEEKKESLKDKNKDKEKKND